MKKILFLFFVISVTGYSQTGKDTTYGIIKSEVSDCIQKIYNDPAAIKELMSTMMRDKENFRRIHRELMSDPEIKQMMHEMRSEMDQSGNQQMNRKDPHRQNEEDKNPHDQR